MVRKYSSEVCGGGGYAPNGGGCLRLPILSKVLKQRATEWNVNEN